MRFWQGVRTESGHPPLLIILKKVIYLKKRSQTLSYAITHNAEIVSPNISEYQKYSK